MIEIKQKNIERAILVGVRTSDILRSELDEHLSELELLADTAGAVSVAKIIQDRVSPDSAFYIGKGKAEEIALLVDSEKIDLVIFDEDLAPTQVRNLENLIKRKILDRSGLILDIFASHARTNEAKTQVELAQLEYTLPRLTRAWTHLSKQYGGIGTKGPGETQIETDRRVIRTRISKLKSKLKQIEQQQSIKRSKRKNLLNAVLVGYTNAGKSTLLNLLTEAEVLAEDKLFATLDSTTRQLELTKNKKVLLSDTVGFIRKLPHNLIASFKSTLDIIREADLVLHIIDVSHPFYEDHIKTVDETLKELDCHLISQIKIFNKIDANDDETKFNYIASKYDDFVLVSALRGFNIEKLKQMIFDFYEKNFIEHSVHLDIKDSQKVSKIHELAEVTSLIYNDDHISVCFRTKPENFEIIKRLVYKNSE
ncbi:MAG: GTPase HflX [Ignavibacteriales bacterium]|nr:GTPase HflX [Ignavibacteriales bacterium]